MGKNNGFSEEDILKLKEAEKGGEGDGGCRSIVILFGLLFMAVGFYVIFFVEGKPSAVATVSETSLFVSDTAVSTSATPTLKPTATATASATATAVASETPIPTNTQLPTQTPYPTYTPYPSATWTAQPTFTPQATWTPEPTHTTQPTYTAYPTAMASPTAPPTAAPVATERPFLAPIIPEANPPGGSYPTWLAWLIGGLFTLALTALGVLAYVSRQMRPPTPAPVASMPPGGSGGTLPPPDWQPVREPRPAPVRAPVTPVSPPEVAPVQEEQGAAPPETIEVSVTDANPDTDKATMRAICTAWNEILERGERPSLNKVCQEYFGGKNSERMAIARRALKWGRAHGHIQTQQTQTKSEVTHDPANRPKPEPKTQNRRRRRPITINGRKGSYKLN